MGRVVVLAGPTASGKSGIALPLAERLGGEIVNADALQLYRGLDIGTAKPGAADRRRVAHHLYDVVDPDRPMSAGEYARLARPVLEAIAGRGRLALVVGGSGFYLKALVDGLDPLPPADPGVRRELAGRLEREGLESLRGELRRLDPATERRLAPGDTQRISRALEVALSTGRPLSEWLADTSGREGGCEAEWIGLTLPRAILYDRIALRIERMVEAGWVDEVRRLLGQGLTIAAPAFQAIGYRQIARHLMGEGSLEQALQETVLATRRYAKRQLTWFRSDPRIHWISAFDPDPAVAEIVGFLARRGLRVDHV